MTLEQMFATPPAGFNQLHGHYSSALVLLSVIVAIVAATLTLSSTKAATESHASNRLLRTIKVISGTLALAGGTWSMHFIGMLAYELPIEVHYEPLGTALSVLPVLIAAAATLALLIRHPGNPKVIIGGGLLLGLGIGLMHYAGMAAMRMNAVMRYSSALVLLSVVVAAVIAVTGLWLSQRTAPLFRSTWADMMLRGSILGSAIASMHYVGMSAVTYHAPELPASYVPVGQPVFAMLVAVVTVSVITLVTIASTLIRLNLLQRENIIHQQRLQAILDTAVDGIITINSHGIIQAANPAAGHILGWKNDEVIGRNVNMLMPEPYRSSHDGYLANYLHSKQAKIIGQGREVTAQHKDGHLVPIRLGVGKVRLPDQTTLFVGFITDISQRKQMEDALRKSEAQYRTLISNMPGVAFRCRVDRNWSMLFISDAISDLTGWPAQAFLDGSVHMAELIHPDDVELCENTIGQAAKNHSRYELEYRIRDRQGRLHWLLDSGVFEFNGAGEVEWIDGVLLDITQRREMEDVLRESKEAAEEAANAKAAFMANMSHEIRTPMNAIIGFSDVMRDGELNAQQAGYLDSISGAAHSLLHLLNDILDSAKLERGKLHLEMRDFSPHQLLDNLVSTYWLSARDKGLQLNLEIDPHLPPYLHGAPERIRQVLTNLLSNAIKFTEQGRVCIQAGLNAQQHIEFKVSDTGIGMSEDALGRIFEPFTQADASMSRRFGGTGLGTTISKQLVELMGGQISARSQEGIGSSFSFWLPLAQGQMPAQPEVTANYAGPELPPLHILIADDIEQNLELLEIVLKRDGHSVVCVRDGAQALEMTEKHRFDLVLMDIQMPNMDGLEAARAIRAREVQANTEQALPIIALTASVQEADRKATEEAGMNGFANKPLEPQKLKAEIARLVIGHSTVAQVPQAAANTAIIDVNQGLDLWGDLARFSAQLAQFFASQPLPALESALQQQDFETLGQQAHAAAGVSGNLAMRQISHQYSALEKQAAKRNPETARQCLEHLADLYQNAQQEMSQIQHAPADTQLSHMPAAGNQTADFAAARQRILQLCQQGQLDDELNHQLQTSCPAPLKPHVNKAINALDAFDFRQAIQILDSIAHHAEEVNI